MPPLTAAVCRNPEPCPSVEHVPSFIEDGEGLLQALVLECKLCGWIEVITPSTR